MQPGVRGKERDSASIMERGGRGVFFFLPKCEISYTI